MDIDRNFLIVILTYPDHEDTNAKQIYTISQSNLPFLLLGMASRPCSSAADEEGQADVPEKRDEAG